MSVGVLRNKVSKNFVADFPSLIHVQQILDTFAVGDWIHELGVGCVEFLRTAWMVQGLSCSPTVLGRFTE